MTDEGGHVTLRITQYSQCTAVPCYVKVVRVSCEKKRGLQSTVKTDNDGDARTDSGRLSK